MKQTSLAARVYRNWNSAASFFSATRKRSRTWRSPRPTSAWRRIWQIPRRTWRASPRRRLSRTPSSPAGTWVSSPRPRPNFAEGERGRGEDRKEKWDYNTQSCVKANEAADVSYASVDRAPICLVFTSFRSISARSSPIRALRVRVTGDERPPVISPSPSAKCPRSPGPRSRINETRSPPPPGALPRADPAD